MRHAAAVVTMLATLAGAAQAQQGPGLADLLAMLPQLQRDRPPWMIFAYADFRAVEAAAGIVPPLAETAVGGAADSFETWPEDRQEAWRFAMRRLLAMPRDLLIHTQWVGRAPVPLVYALGVDWFAIDRVIVVGDQPQVTVLAGDGPLTDDETLAWSDLRLRGFARVERDGVPVWHRFDDDIRAIQLTDEDMRSDPFDGDVMAAMRMALAAAADWVPGREGGVAVITENWADLDAVLAMRSGDAAALTTAPLLLPMIEAARQIPGVDPRPVQAWAMELSLLAMGNAPGMATLLDMLAGSDGQIDLDEALAQSEAGAADRTPLPAYPLALFVDLQAGSDQVNAILLPYADRGDADAAAASLGRALADWVPAGSTHGPLVAEVGGAVETLVVDAPALAGPVALGFLALTGERPTDAQRAALDADAAGNAGAIAIAAVRYPMPSAGGAEPERAGRVIHTWHAAILARSFDVLAVE
ncbi:MAG: hypothetical protein R3F55_22580 [Alphaproteobacteria bacterium]